MTELDRVSNDNNQTSDKSYKYLGILLDENLSFEAHVSYLTAKISKSLYFLSKVKNFLPKKALLNLYYALIHPHFLYCSNIIGCANTSTLKKIGLLQKNAIRLINNKKHNFPTTQLFLNHGILPFKQILEYQKSSFMHSVFYGYCPKTFDDIFTKNPVRHDHDLRNHNNFTVPRPRIDWFKRMPPFSFTSHWNSLEEAKLYNNRKTFQIMLKGRLLLNLATNN